MFDYHVKQDFFTLLKLQLLMQYIIAVFGENKNKAHYK